MQHFSIALAAIVLYLVASVRIATPAGEATAKRPNRKALTIVLLIAAATLHGMALYGNIFAVPGTNLGIFNAASLAGWCIAVCLLVMMFWRPIHSLAVVIFPLIALIMALAALLPSSNVLAPGTPLGIQAHIAFSIIAYSLFAIAAVQALYLGVADYKLRHHHPIMEFLPPLPTMESVLFQLTGVAFALLTLSLVLGSLYIADIKAQHLSHKIVFSVLAWLVFAILLIGRWRFGWRGRRAVKFVVAGFALLAIGFFGSKIVLELILQRV